MKHHSSTLATTAEDNDIVTNDESNEADLFLEKNTTAEDNDNATHVESNEADLFLSPPSTSLTPSSLSKQDDIHNHNDTDFPTSSILARSVQLDKKGKNFKDPSSRSPNPYFAAAGTTHHGPPRTVSPNDSKMHLAYEEAEREKERKREEEDKFEQEDFNTVVKMLTYCTTFSGAFCDGCFMSRPSGSYMTITALGGLSVLKSGLIMTPKLNYLICDNCFHTDLFVCEHCGSNCGGTYDEIAAHEKTCSSNSSKLKRSSSSSTDDNEQNGEESKNERNKKDVTCEIEKLLTTEDTRQREEMEMDQAMMESIMSMEMREQADLIQALDESRRAELLHDEMEMQDDVYDNDHRGETKKGDSRQNSNSNGGDSNGRNKKEVALEKDKLSGAEEARQSEEYQKTFLESCERAVFIQRLVLGEFNSDDGNSTGYDTASDYESDQNDYMYLYQNMTPDENVPRMQHDSELRRADRKERRENSLKMKTVSKDTVDQNTHTCVDVQEVRESESSEAKQGKGSVHVGEEKVSSGRKVIPSKLTKGGNRRKRGGKKSTRSRRAKKKANERTRAASFVDESSILNVKKSKLQWKDDVKKGGERWCLNLVSNKRFDVEYRHRVKASERVKCECKYCLHDAGTERLLEWARWKKELDAWEHEDLFFKECLSKSKKEFHLHFKWRQGHVGCFCRDHSELRLKFCREAMGDEQEELWKANKKARKLIARKRCAPVR